jgi:hypothetical protein
MTDFKLSCFRCGEEGHTIRECDLAKQILEYGRYLRAEQYQKKISRFSKFTASV